MADRPIIFSAPMVRALLAGTKTQTRRVIKPQPHDRAKGCYHRPDGSWVWVDAHREDNGTGYYGNRLDDSHFRLPYAPGDRLYVREQFSGPHVCDENGWAPTTWATGVDDAPPLWYWADGNPDWGDWTKPKPSIHMPRWASRLTLTVAEVRVQRLQEISEADAVAEGAPAPQIRMYPELGTARHWYADLWNSLHGPGSWEANPWVVAVSFDVRQGNIDEVAR